MAATPGPSQARRHRAAERLVQHIVASWRCQALHTAVQLDLPDALRDGPRSATDLATALACDADGLARLLRALCTLGVARSRGVGRRLSMLRRPRACPAPPSAGR